MLQNVLPAEALDVANGQCNVVGGEAVDDHVEPTPVQDPRLVPQQTERCQGRQVHTGDV